MNKRDHYFVLTVTVLFIVVLIFISINFHHYFEEFDGIWQIFEGKLILNGHGYSGSGSNYWGPLYTLTLLSGYKISGNWFLVGKIISVLSMGLLGFVVWKITLLMFTSYNYKIIPPILWFITPAVIVKSLQVENETLSALLAVSSIYFFLKYYEDLRTSSLLLYSIVGGFALLTRYTNVFLLFLPFLLVFRRRKIIDNFKNHHGKIWKALLFLTPILLLPLGYVIYSIVLKGSFLQLNYVNVGLGLDLGNKYEIYQNYDSFFDLISTHFLSFTLRYLKNILSALATLIRNYSIAPVALLALLGFYLRFPKFNKVELGTVGSLGIFLVVRSIGPPKHTFLILLPLLLPFSIFAVEDIITRFHELGKNVRRDKNGKKLGVAIIGLVLMFSVILSARNANQYLFDHFEIHTTDIKKVGNFLKQQSTVNNTILAVHPGYAYYSGLNHVGLPKEGLSWDFMKLEDYPKKYKQSDPYYLYHKDKDGLIDFLILDKKTLGYPTHFNQYYNKSSISYKNYNLSEIYRTNKAVIYKIMPISTQ